MSNQAEVSKADNDALEAQFESQFQKPGDLVEQNDDEGGPIVVDSLCMNCHEQGYVLKYSAGSVLC